MQRHQKDAVVVLTDIIDVGDKSHFPEEPFQRRNTTCLCPVIDFISGILFVGDSLCHEFINVGKPVLRLVLIRLPDFRIHTGIQNNLFQKIGDQRGAVLVFLYKIPEGIDEVHERNQF